MTKEEVRGAARARRVFIEAGGTMTLEEAREACLTMVDALLVFEGTEESDEGTAVFCCGGPANIRGGILGEMVECPRCGAKAVDATSPMWSPFLERGNSYVTCPSKEWVESFGARTWLVMHEGNRVTARDSRGSAKN